MVGTGDSAIEWREEHAQLISREFWALVPSTEMAWQGSTGGAVGLVKRAGCVGGLKKIGGCLDYWVKWMWVVVELR